jgi:anti-sigma factor ChrR (cupin superfamily)
MNVLSVAEAYEIMGMPGGFASLPWKSFREGIEIHRLYQNADGGSAALLKYAPRTRLPRHTHVGWEHILILEGCQIDDIGMHHAGTLLVHAPGTSHSVRTETGCVVLAIWEKPVLFDERASE